MIKANSDVYLNPKMISYIAVEQVRSDPPRPKEKTEKGFYVTAYLIGSEDSCAMSPALTEYEARGYAEFFMTVEPISYEGYVQYQASIPPVTIVGESVDPSAESEYKQAGFFRFATEMRIKGAQGVLISNLAEEVAAPGDIIMYMKVKPDGQVQIKEDLDRKVETLYHD